MIKCTMCNIEINLINTKGCRTGNTTMKSDTRKCGRCYLIWKREERRKNGQN